MFFQQNDQIETLLYPIMQVNGTEKASLMLRFIYFTQKENINDVVKLASWRY